MDLILTTFLLILLLWCLNRRRLASQLKLINKLPSNKWQTLLGFGNIHTSKDMLTSIYAHSKIYGPNSVFWMGPYPFYLTTDPVSLKDILNSKNCVDKPDEVYNGINLVAGRGSISENDPIWTQHRKMLNKSVSNKILMSLLPIFHEEVSLVIDQIEKSVIKGEKLRLLEIFRESTLKNATRTILKRNLRLQSKFNSKTMSKQFEQMLVLVADACSNYILTFKWILELAKVSVYKGGRDGFNQFFHLIDESVDMAEKNESTDTSGVYTPLDSVLDGLKQNAIKKDEIQGVLMHIFLGTFDTSSSLLFYALTMLAMHPEYQERAYEEVCNTISDIDAELTLNDLNQLVYLEMIFNETMRLMPPIPMVLRKVTNKNFTLSNGLTLPVGQIICIDIFRLHRTKKYWGPEAPYFNPDNFLPANVAARHPYSFIPFTKGQRFCYGWRYGTLFFKFALAKFIAKFKVSTDFKYENFKFQNHISLKMIEEPILHLELRHKA